MRGTNRKTCCSQWGANTRPSECHTKVITKECLCGHWGTKKYVYRVSFSYAEVLLFPSQYLCGMILLTMYSILWDWLVLGAGPMLFYWPMLVASFHPTVFPFLSFGNEPQRWPTGYCDRLQCKVARVRAPLECRFSVRCKGIARHRFLWCHYWTDWVLYRQFGKNG